MKSSIFVFYRYERLVSILLHQNTLSRPSTIDKVAAEITEDTTETEIEEKLTIKGFTMFSNKETSRF